MAQTRPMPTDVACPRSVYWCVSELDTLVSNAQCHNSSRCPGQTHVGPRNHVYGGTQWTSWQMWLNDRCTTAVWLTQNMEQGLWNCQASVFLSVCPILHHSRGMPQVCCCGLLGQAISIIYCTARLQPVEPPFYPYPQQHAGQQQMWAVSCLQRRSKLNTDLYQITLTTSFSMLVTIWTLCQTFIKLLGWYSYRSFAAFLLLLVCVCLNWLVSVETRRRIAWIPPIRA